ncbi:MAG: nucleotidyltransferase [Bacteroidetes bacterium GWF2_33_38]|nr:MAG: nucleotidyltransferase [Bacteroidetes bacterium GWF2_33_38]OFY72783.1 MAG: nucleotidyltransferase [Bacteroidetes bacterium RIFOXYA12_FULL_33_9]OFY91558.1 MAG: nucleotidyltransferase [Bacteroidetes bacterium RIFOXYA2_FULL_33_7]HBX50596.1 nucleotidyltransferase [Bacteroidales bacterium]
MNNNLQKYTINQNASLIEALKKMSEIPDTLNLFVLNDQEELIGTLTDGDVRRGLINGLNVNSKLIDFIFRDFQYIKAGNFDKKIITIIRKKNIKIVPILDNNNQIIKLLNFKKIKSLIPADAVLMAGGEGLRLRPLTEKTPKPLLKIGGKAIIEYNIDRLQQFGIQNQFISINYLGEQIISFCKHKESDINFKFIRETKPLGTIGSVKLVEHFENDYILIMNSDLLTNINFEDFYDSFVSKNADMIVAAIPYKVDLPYAIFETEDRNILSFKEKPSYTYYANAGIYLIKKELINLIPSDEIFNATDFMQAVINKGLQVVHYPIRSYWLDIGNPDDFEKAQRDVSHIDFD